MRYRWQWRRQRQTGHRTKKRQRQHGQSLQSGSASEKLERLKEAKSKLEAGQLDLNALDEFVNFKDSNSQLDGLIGQIQGTPGSATDYAAQATRGVLGFVKDGVMGIGELAYEGIKAVPKIGRSLYTSADQALSPLDAQILAENKILVTDKAAKRVKKKHRLAGMTPQAATQNGDAVQEMPAIAHTASNHNTVGCGFAEPWYLSASKIKRLPAPQITAPHARISGFGQALTPGEFGVIARAWQPRLALAGTYDQSWLEQRHPYLPADFNFAYWNGAPADQQISPHLDGDERITLSNLCAANGPGARNVTRDTAGNTQLSLCLPGHLPFILVRFADGQIGELAAGLDIILIDSAPEANDPAKKTFNAPAMQGRRQVSIRK